MTDDRYNKFKEARKTGGPCEVCGWRDGDGVATCFYSPELGTVTHQNSEAGAMATMMPEQRDLFKLRQALLYVNADLRERHIAKVARDHAQRRERWERDNPDVPFNTNANGDPVSAAEWMANYRTQQEREPLATDAPYCDWLQSPWWIPAQEIPEELRGLVATDKRGRRLTAYRVHCYEQHAGCGGIQVHLGPYHLGCSRCAVEVRLWEHGIDYDVG